MTERLDVNKIPVEKNKKNIRQISKETAHLKKMVGSYKKRADVSSFLLTDLEGLIWEQRIILDGQIWILRKKRGDILEEEAGPCPFHGPKNDDFRSAIVKIDVPKIKKAIVHLEEMIEVYSKRKNISPSLLKQLEWNLSEYYQMISSNERVINCKFVQTKFDF